MSNYPVNDSGKQVIPWADLDLSRASASGNSAVKCPACIDDRKKKGVKSFQVHTGKGYGQCHHCGAISYDETRKKDQTYVPMKKTYELPKINHYNEVSDEAKSWFRDTRKIHEATLKTWGIQSATMWMPQTQKDASCIAFPYYDGEEIINTKYRDARKNFRMEKNAKQVLYGLNTLIGADNAIFVEGEIDALSFYEAGFKHVVSTPNGAPSLTDQEKDNFSNTGSFESDRAINLEYLDNCIDHIKEVKSWYIGVDNDLPGRRLQDELVRRFGAENCYIIDWGIFKDANECLCHPEGGIMKLQELVENAKPVPLDKVSTAEDSLQKLKDIAIKGYPLGLSIGLPDFDKHYRIRSSELDLFVGGANQGKSYYIFWLMLVISIKHQWRWAVYVPENSPPEEFFRVMIQMLTGKTFKKGFPNSIKVHEVEIATAWLNDHFFVCDYSNEDTPVTYKVLLEKFRELVFRKGINGCLIDPLNDLDMERSPGVAMDEYNQKMLGTIRKFKQRYSLKFMISAHPNSESDRAIDTDSQGRKCPKVIELSDVSGGSIFKNRIDNGTSVYRNFWYDETRFETQVHVKKIKFQESVGVPTRRDWPISLIYDVEISRFRCNNIDPIEGFFEKELLEPVVNPPQSEMNFVSYSHDDALDRFENEEQDSLTNQALDEKPPF